MKIKLFGGAVLGALVVAACSSAPEDGTEAKPEEATSTQEGAQTAPTDPTGTGSSFHRYGVVPFRGGVQQAVTPVCTGPKLTYIGGPIVMSPVIVPVFWNGNVNASVTNPTTGVAQFFADVTVSSFWPWLQEYDTVGTIGGKAGTGQAVLAGTATAGITLTPSVCPSTASTKTCKVTDAQIQAELTAQINANVLPAPQVDCTGNARTIYMIEFPPLVQVSGPSGVGNSCAAFCAYHSTGTYGAAKTPLLYGVLMDEITAACKTGCGTNPTGLDNMTDTASHELAETVTDPDIGLLPTNATMAELPMGWYDSTNSNCGEIGDICDDGGNGDTITVNGRTWYVQELWSNKQNKCTSTGTTSAVCSGTTVTSCRLCSCGDDGNACGGSTTVCETTSSNVLFGGCEQCTSTDKTACGTGTCTQSTTPAQDDVCSSGCVPLTTCPAPDDCGTISNGCGAMLTCGTCTAPQTCGGGGTANVCGCTPAKTCPAGDDCGTVSDGCGGMITCGTCTAPQTCAGGGTANVCGCTPAKTCPAGDDCGTVPDGCGGMLTCGTCTAPQTCGGAGKANVCGCTPIKTCPAGDDCGSVPDGCGGMLGCGTCTAPQTCGGGGTANVCGAACAPRTCASLGATCGTAPDGCGGILSCGPCGTGDSCVANQCVATTPDAGSAKDSGAGGMDSGSPADSGTIMTPDSGTAADSGSGTGDSGSGMIEDSGSTTVVDSGTTTTPDSGTSTGSDSSAPSADGSTPNEDGSAEGGEGDGGPGTSQSGNNGGCGCRVVDARESGPSPALLAMGIFAALGGLRLRRRTRR
jgi:MYXO-CTERM domain-containing protein